MSNPGAVKHSAPAPTARDRAQSDTHHVDSVRYNLAHAGTHLKEAARHAQAISGALRRDPRFRTHVRALSNMLSPRR